MHGHMNTKYMYVFVYIGVLEYVHVYIYIYLFIYIYVCMYRGAVKSLARPSSRCILFDVENISIDASLDLYIYIYY
jgi:hypothetical protein